MKSRRFGISKLRKLVRTLVGRPDGRNPVFVDSAQYWEDRYSLGGTSGLGSYNELAEFKARFLNEFVRKRRVQTVIEFGCGDGNQLSLCNYPNYLGVDVSPTAVIMCRKRFAKDESKMFVTLSEYAGQRAQLALSLDVLFHLVEDATFESYMRTLFDSAEQYVIIYSSNTEVVPIAQAAHVRHRAFTEWIERYCSGWKLESVTKNRYPFDAESQAGSLADFYVYRREDA